MIEPVTPPAFDPSPPASAQDAAAARAQWVADIDNACAAIYIKVGRFAEEYKLREAHALAYQAAGHSGQVPRQVAAYATPAGLTPQAATSTILGQAAAYRGALEALGELRMRKMEVLNAPSNEAATTIRAQIMTSIAAISAALG